MFKIRVAFLLLGLGALMHAPLSAQDYSLPPIIDNVGMGNIAIGSAAQAHVRQSQERGARQTENDNRRSLVAPGTSSSTADANVDFSYRYDRARTQQNLRTFVDRSSGGEAKAGLQQMLSAQPGLIQQIRSGMSSYGFDPDNAADAYAMWWMNVWMAANKQDADPSRNTIESVKRQVRNAFAATPEFANTTDAQRQEYAEALMLQASMLSTAFDQFKSDPAMLDQLAQAARQGAKANGLDLSLMTLTRDGFVPRKGADAQGALPDSDAELASSDLPTSDESPFDGGLALGALAGVGIMVLGVFALRNRA